MLFILHGPDFTDKQVLVEFGADPDEVAEIQSLLKGRASQRSTTRPGSKSKDTSDGVDRAFSLSETSQRSKRKLKIPDAFLPKVAIVGRPNVGKYIGYDAQ